MHSSLTFIRRAEASYGNTSSKRLGETTIRHRPQSSFPASCPARSPCRHTFDHIILLIVLGPVQARVNDGRTRQTHTEALRMGHGFNGAVFECVADWQETDSGHGGRETDGGGQGNEDIGGESHLGCDGQHERRWLRACRRSLDQPVFRSHTDFGNTGPACREPSYRRKSEHHTWSRLH